MDFNYQITEIKYIYEDVQIERFDKPIVLITINYGVEIKWKIYLEPLNYEFYEKQKINIENSYEKDHPLYEDYSSSNLGYPFKSNGEVFRWNYSEESFCSSQIKISLPSTLLKELFNDIVTIIRYAKLNKRILIDEINNKENIDR